MVSLWELEWERERWEVEKVEEVEELEEVEEVEWGRGRANEEVATARPRLIHSTEVEEDSTCYC